MPLHFTKMHGLLNDYVYVSLFDQRVDDPRALARRISDRHAGVGSDGLILVAPPDSPAAHVRMIMFNADGSRAQMCGNGIRCVAKLAYERGWARHNPLKVQTDRGVLELRLTIDPDDRVTLVRVDMGPPILEPRQIPVRLPGERVIDSLVEINDEAMRLTCVSMGNPHAVVFVDDLAAVPLARWGALIERHPIFPERVNAHFVQLFSPTHVRVATWERGAGATQACGTGAAAVCVAGVLTERTGRAITATLPGGDLQLEWDQTSGHVFMTGPASEVFTGVWPD